MKEETRDIMIRKIIDKKNQCYIYPSEYQLTIGTAIYELRRYKKIANDYINEPEDYVKEHIVVINGKRRHIVTYASSDKGAALRQLHHWFKFFLSFIYEPADNSFAYRRGLNVKLCLNEHLENNTFLKTDIHSYFDSIQFDTLYNKICIHDGNKTSRKRLLRDILSACFHKGRLPIGFVSSPILSDIYLHELDTEMLNDETITYTRYADDIIVSVSDNAETGHLDMVRQKIIDQITPLGLELNTKKTYIRQLVQTGDAIHLLGLNLVKTDSHVNRITVSDQYIRETSKDLCSLIYGHNNMKPADAISQFYKVSGRIQYILDSSESSGCKFRKLLKIKTGMDIDLSPKQLRELCLEGDARAIDIMERSSEAHYDKQLARIYTEYFTEQYWNFPQYEYDIHLSELALPLHTYKELRKDGYEWYSQVKDLTENDLLSYSYVGPISYKKFCEAIASSAEAYEIMKQTEITLEDKLREVINIRFHKDTSLVSGVNALREIIMSQVMRKMQSL